MPNRYSHKNGKDGGLPLVKVEERSTQRVPKLKGGSSSVPSGRENLGDTPRTKGPPKAVIPNASSDHRPEGVSRFDGSRV